MQTDEVVALMPEERLEECRQVALQCADDAVVRTTALKERHAIEVAVVIAQRDKATTLLEAAAAERDQLRKHVCAHRGWRRRSPAHAMGRSLGGASGAVGAGLGPVVEEHEDDFLDEDEGSEAGTYDGFGGGRGRPCCARSLL